MVQSLKVKHNRIANRYSLKLRNNNQLLCFPLQYIKALKNNFPKLRKKFSQINYFNTFLNINKFNYQTNQKITEPALR
jgi:hypothetical protein